MLPGIAPQNEAAAPQAADAVGAQLPLDGPGPFDAALDAAFDAAAVDAAAVDAAGADAPPPNNAETAAAVDPSSLCKWWLSRTDAAQALDGDADSAAARVSAKSLSDDDAIDEDAIEEDAVAEDSQDAPQAVPVELSPLVPVATPIDEALSVDGLDVEQTAGQDQAATIGGGAPDAEPSLTRENTRIAVDDGVFSPPRNRGGEPSRAIAARDEVGGQIDRQLQNQSASGVGEAPATGEDAEQRPTEMPRAIASNIVDMPKPSASHAVSVTANADAVSKPAAPMSPQSSANANAAAAVALASVVKVPSQTGTSAAAPAGGEDAVSTEVPVKAEAVSPLAEAQGNAFKDASQQEGKEDTAHGSAAPEPVFRSVGPAQTPSMVLVQAPDGTLRFAPAASMLTSLAPTPQDRSENIAALVQTMRVQIREGVSEATVHLHPEHLGEVSIAIRVDGKSVSAVINAESAGVREWIQSQESTLRSGLSEQGLNLDRLLVQRDPRHDRREQAQPERRRARAKRGQENERFEVSA